MAGRDRRVAQGENADVICLVEVGEHRAKHNGEHSVCETTEQTDPPADDSPFEDRIPVD
jgi:hypothetical protein